MVSETSSKVSSSLPPRRDTYNTSSSSTSSSTLSSSVRFSVPPSIGRVRVSQSVDRDYNPSLSRPRDSSVSSHQTKSRGTSPATGSSTTKAYNVSAAAGASLPTFRRRYSLSSTSPGGQTDLGGLDHRTVKDIDDELDFDPRRSAASMIRRARRNDVIYTADGARQVGSTYRSEAGLGQTSSVTSRPRSRSNSRRRELHIDSTNDYTLDNNSVTIDDDTDDVIRRRARSAMARSRSRAMSLPRVETPSTVSAAASQSYLGSRQHCSPVASSSSLNSRAATNSVRASSVTRSQNGVYSAPATGSSPVGRSISTSASASSSASASTYVVDLPGRRGAVNGNGEGWDIASFVLQPGEKFVPTDVSVNVLPSGLKAVTYTRFSQTGHGDQGSANVEIERVIQRTKRMQESMHTLENFVKRNRSLFPEDIIIYQHIVFYLLDSTELKRLGMKPDAEVYGVKVRERLVAPHGTDVTAILKRYYSRYTEVEVEYLEQEDIRRKLREEMAEGGTDEDAKSKRRRQYRTDIEETTETETEIEMRRNRLNNKQRQSTSVERHHKSADRKVVVDEDETGKRRARQQPEQVAPQFTTRLQPKRVQAGDMVRLNCSVTGNPDPVVTWYRGNQQIIDNERFYINNSFGLCTLKILDARKEDAGVYTAKAVNCVGEMTTCADILVEGKEDSKVSREEATRKPWFLIDAQNTTAQVGQLVVLEAQAAGRPLPTCRWQKDGVIVELGSRVRQVSDEFGNIKLMIRDVKPSDAGVYVCIAENDTGYARCSAALRVTTDTVDRRPHHENNGVDWDKKVTSLSNRQVSTSLYIDDYDESVHRTGRKPKFVELPPSNIEITEGEPLTLRCAVDGDPRPVVTWYKGVRELTYSERHRVLAETDTQYMMQVKWTLQTDPGEYTVVATNSLGHASFTVYVNVLPRLPDDIEVSGDRKHPALREYELIKKMKQGKMPPVFIRKLPLEKTLKVGQTLVIKCSIKEAKMKEYLSGIDIVVKDAVRELPDFLVTPADEEISAPPAAVPATNGHDADDVSVTVLKNVVHITDDTQNDSEQFVRPVAPSNIADDVNDAPTATSEIKDITSTSSGALSEAADLAPSVAEADRTNKEISNRPGTDDILPAAVADSLPPESVRVAQQTPLLIVTEDENDKNDYNATQITPTDSQQELKDSAADEDIPSIPVATSVETVATDIAPVEPETLSTLYKSDVLREITDTTPVEPVPILSTDTIQVTPADTPTDVEVKRSELDCESLTQVAQGPSESVSSSDVLPSADPLPDSTGAADAVAEKKIKSKKSKKTESSTKGEEELETAADQEETKKSKRKSGKPKKSKKKETGSENQEDEQGEAVNDVKVDDSE